MRNCLVINLDRCSGCDSCVAACKFENNIGLGVYQNRVAAIGPNGTWPDIEMYWIPFQCQQCEEASCIEVCPTGASHRDETTGTVQVDEDVCIGCQACIKGCPFGARMMDEKANVAKKCSLCFQRIADSGRLPACVESCCTGARFYGDLDDPESDVSKELAKYDESCIFTLPDPAGNAPATRYILSPKIAAWTGEY